MRDPSQIPCIFATYYLFKFLFNSSQYLRTYYKENQDCIIHLHTKQYFADGCAAKYEFNLFDLIYSKCMAVLIEFPMGTQCVCVCQSGRSMIYDVMNDVRLWSWPFLFFFGPNEELFNE